MGAPEMRAPARRYAVDGVPGRPHWTWESLAGDQRLSGTGMLHVGEPRIAQAAVCPDVLLAFLLPVGGRWRPLAVELLRLEIGVVFLGWGSFGFERAQAASMLGDCFEWKS